MDLSDDLDLDSLIGLIDENDPEIKGSVAPSEAEKSSTRSVTISNVDVDIFSSATPESSGTTITADGQPSLVHTGDTSEEEEEEKEDLTETGQLIKQKIKLKSNYDNHKREKSTWASKIKPKTDLKENAQSFDKTIGIRIVNPLVSFDVMEKRLQGRKLIKMSFMKNFMQKGDIEGDWVTIGVVVKKVPPKTSKNGKVFSIWKLTDLHYPDKLASLFLFGEVHKEHWKTSAGAVVGLLNPSFLEARDKDDYASMTVDHPGKIMQIGTSKDFGHCKSVRKDGTQCTNVVNLSQCQFCAYHVKNEYKKFSKRSDIQTSWSGRDLSLKDRVLKGQKAIFYAGQTFVPLGKPERKPSSVSQKDKLTLSNLTLKRKAETVFREEKQQSIKKINEMYGESVSKAAEKNSEFINQKLTIPSPGSRNLLCLMRKNQVAKGEAVDLRSAKDLLKQNMQHMNARKMPTSISNKRDDGAILRNLVPVLGKGLSPGQNLSFDFTSPRNSSAPEHYAKLRAIQKIKQNGPIVKKNPNATKSNPEPKKIQSILESSFEEEPGERCTMLNPMENSLYLKVKGMKKRNPCLGEKLGCIDLNSEKVQKYLKQKSSHAFEVELAEMEKEAAYFARMEQKEQMEEKMCAQKEMVCDVVSCKQCRYTAHHAADRCKSENHPLKCHKAIKRFFECKDCHSRTECFSRFPQRSCRNCGGSRFERTGMMRARSGPKLDSEILHITGDDVKYLNSL